MALERLKKIYGTYSQGKFWLLATLISLFSAYLIGHTAINGLGENRDVFTVAILILAVAGVSVLPLAVWQQVARKRFFTRLDSQWENLNTGATHPDGYVVTFDTPLVQYKVVISALLLGDLPIKALRGPTPKRRRRPGKFHFSFLPIRMVVLRARRSS